VRYTLFVTGDQWCEVEELFAELIELGPTQRAARLSGETSHNIYMAYLITRP